MYAQIVNFEMDMKNADDLVADIQTWTADFGSKIPGYESVNVALDRSGTKGAIVVCFDSKASVNTIAEANMDFGLSMYEQAKKKYSFRNESLFLGDVDRI